jgi:hypothetical protein
VPDRFQETANPLDQTDPALSPRVRPIDGELPPLEDEGHGRSGAFVDFGAEVLQIRLDLLPVKSRIEAPYLVQGVVVPGHGTMMQYRRFPVKAARPAIAF